MYLPDGTLGNVYRRKSLQTIGIRYELLLPWWSTAAARQQEHSLETRLPEALLAH